MAVKQKSRFIVSLRSRNSNERKIQKCSLFIAYVFTMFCCILYISEYQLQVSAAQAAIED